MTFAQSEMKQGRNDIESKENTSKRHRIDVVLSIHLSGSRPRDDLSEWFHFEGFADFIATPLKDIQFITAVQRY